MAGKIRAKGISVENRKHVGSCARHGGGAARGAHEQHRGLPARRAKCAYHDARNGKSWRAWRKSTRSEAGKRRLSSAFAGARRARAHMTTALRAASAPLGMRRVSDRKARMSGPA
eukprot:6177048-Pleurochrysis_carterae.AAC.4